MGLLTFAAYMPRDEWDFELIDLSVNIPSEDLLHQKIKAADAVFTGAMNIQRQSLVALLKGPAMGTDTLWVLGGPMASTYRDTILTPQTKEDRILHDGLDFLVWGEVAPWIEGLCAALEQYPAHRQITPELFIPQRVLDEPSGSRKYPSILYMDLQAAGRLHTQGQASNNLDDAVEYQPTMGIEELQTGYRHILTTLFNRDTLYKRTKAMLNRLDLHICSHRRTELKVGLRSIFQQGLLGAQGLFDREYFKLLLYAHRLDRTKL